MIRLSSDKNKQEELAYYRLVDVHSRYSVYLSDKPKEDNENEDTYY